MFGGGIESLVTDQARHQPLPRSDIATNNYESFTDRSQIVRRFEDEPLLNRVRSAFNIEDGKA